MRIFLLIGTVLLMVGCAAGNNRPQHRPVTPTTLSDLETLGRNLYFDASLSEPPGQSCATCHDPTVGWTGPREEINREGGVYPGAVHSRFGNRKPPSAAYATPSPVLHYDETEALSWEATSGMGGRPAGCSASRPPSRPRDRFSTRRSRISPTPPPWSARSAPRFTATSFGMSTAPTSARTPSMPTTPSVRRSSPTRTPPN